MKPSFSTPIKSWNVPTIAARLMAMMINSGVPGFANGSTEEKVRRLTIATGPVAS